ncbi:hypothetical protein INT48_003923 [Thamnidium elegans]|uniref:Uncharacterized protein n=1 Tax=Thamnidium elegans TaxID=101142 RepID=A0A8H7SVG5_9FUNG|nr:hypothetical protein INT48_003923 [Thamnidium elegans]
MDIVVSTLFGDHAKDIYYFSPTQRSTENTPDAVYVSRSNSFPPIIIGIQHTVDLNYYLQMTSHGVSAALQYHTPPILITFVTSTIRYEVKKRIIPYPPKPFLQQVRQCDPWARNCYFVTSDSIQQSLKADPLNTFVALSFFVIVSQCGRPSENPYYGDPTMARLYAIAEQMFGDEGNIMRQIKEDLMYVCTESKKRLREAISALDQSDVPQAAKKKVNNCVGNAVRVFDAYQTKYQEPTPASPNVETGLISEGVPTSPADSSPTDSSPTDSSASSRLPARSRTENWNFISNRLSELDENGNIPWRAIYVDGRRDRNER